MYDNNMSGKLTVFRRLLGYIVRFFIGNRTPTPPSESPMLSMYPMYPG